MASLLSEVKDYENEIIKIRRQIHANPELTYKEFETTTKSRRNSDPLESVLRRVWAEQELLDC